MASSVSQSIGDRFGLILSEDLCDWLDRAWCGYRLEGEFDQSVSPQQLLEDSIEILWPGFMLPDTLPIVSNRYGDWLCLRIGSDNRVSEVVHWYHGGGDFVPFGANLAEALLYDCCQDVIPNRPTWHAPAPPDPALPSVKYWIAQQLASSFEELTDIIEAFRQGEMHRGLSMLRSRGWCLDAVDRDSIDEALATPLRQIADPKLALRLGVSWEREMTRWLFDTRSIPDNYRKVLQELFENRADWDQQDWLQAESIAAKAMERRTDLAWAADIAGWGAYRRGDTDLAITRWTIGMSASVYSDQSTMFRSHWFAQDLGKFSIAMLMDLKSQLPASLQQNPYWQTLIRLGTLTASQRATEYWYQVAMAEPSSDLQYQAWYRAGWDVGCTNISLFRSILSGLADSALRAGWSGRHAVARSYLQKLQATTPPTAWR